MECEECGCQDEFCVFLGWHFDESIGKIVTSYYCGCCEWKALQTMYQNSDKDEKRRLVQMYGDKVKESVC